MKKHNDIFVILCNYYSQFKNISQCIWKYFKCTEGTWFSSSSSFVSLIEFQNVLSVICECINKIFKCTNVIIKNYRNATTFFPFFINFQFLIILDGRIKFVIYKRPYVSYLPHENSGQIWIVHLVYMRGCDFPIFSYLFTFLFTQGVLW